ncbi:MAG: UDP-N-acetylmuramoyl-L-alanine--D-glutamate ligase [Candidatus Hydrogenedentota bacterium]
MAFSFDNARVTILGWARSGRAAARLASARGARVFISDAKPRDKFDEEALTEIASFDHELGGHTARVLDADIVILSPGIPTDVPALAEFKGKIWSELELAARIIPCPIVAITGTNGKTTTTTLLGEILKKGWRKGRVHVAGNIGTAAAHAAEEACPDDLCVLEISSFQLETIRAFRPRIAVWLNLRSDHLDRYSSIEEYQAAKERIFMNMRDPDIAIVNIDDPRSAELADRLRARKQDGPRILTISTIESADFTPDALCQDRILNAAKSPENLLAAVAVARLLQIGEPDIQASLDSFQGLPHRIEPVGTCDGVAFYDDSKATNVHSVEAALKRLDPPIVLLMGGRDKGENYRELHRLVKEKCRAVVSYGEAAARIRETLGGDIVPRFDDAVRHSFRLARPDACVLLSPACSSYDQFTDYAARGNRFKALVSELRGV